MRLKQSEKILIIIALLLFVLVIFNKVYIIPQKDQIKVLKEMLNGKEELYKEYLYLTKNKTFFDKNLKKLERQYKKIEGLIWGKGDYQEIASSFLEMIDTISKKAKVSILRKNILDKKAHPYFDEVRVSLQITAPLPNILYFLYLIRNEKKAVFIKKFSIYIPEQGLPTTTIEFSTLRKNKNFF